MDLNVNCLSKNEFQQPEDTEIFSESYNSSTFCKTSCTLTYSLQRST